MSIERDRCAVSALTIALKYLRGPEREVVSGNERFTQRGQDVEYIRMTLDLYHDVQDESGRAMVPRDPNQMILDRVLGATPQRGTPDTDADLRNPNAR